MGDLLGVLQALARKDGQIAHVEHLPARPARFGQLDRDLADPLESYLTAAGIRLWSHQVEAIDEVRAGKDVILATSTASGKTLAFNLPVLERLLLDPEATALYIYPTKALANDQLASIRDLQRASGLSASAEIYDGDTPQDRRSRIRKSARIVITNPYGLHQYLPSNHLWERFLSNLAVVVIDEAHWYRGVFGTNVAMVIRRLRRLAESYGASPVFVLASGTIANPKAHAENLVGRAFHVVSESGAPSGPKDFVLWNPLADPHRSQTAQSASILANLASQGHQSLCFAASRRMAELIARRAQDSAPSARIVAYRAGYQAGERREIEDGLRRGDIDAVVSTNALELGINIGGLDAVVMNGYPGTICSMWQQAGRAGREQEESTAVLVAFADPLDQYLIAHPEELFGKSHEQAVIDLCNPRILRGHLLCAASEMPLTDGDMAFFGQTFWSLTEDLEAKGDLASTPMGKVFHGTHRPVDKVPLSAIDEEAVELRCDGRVLEVLSVERAMRTAHPGAILLHRGEGYRVEDLDLAHGIATAVREETDNHTESKGDTDVKILRQRSHRSIGVAELALGDVSITETVTSYKLKLGDQVLTTRGLHLPPIKYETVAIWVSFPETARSLGMAPHDYAGGLHAAEHGLVQMMPLLAMCDRGDVKGMSTPSCIQTGSGTIFVYDGYHGGIGIAEKVFEQFESLAKIAVRLLGGCHCATGCPSCVYDRNCRYDNQPMDRVAGALILKRTLGTQIGTEVTGHDEVPS